MDMNPFLDIWHGNLEIDESEEQYYLSLLNAQEIEKAKTFSRQEVQKNYIKTRAVLRKILSTYLNILPSKIVINIAKYGKPYIPDCKVCFNLSHSHNKFVVAVSNSEVGVDVETGRDRKRLPALVEKCFSDRERQYWHALPKEQQTTMFFRFWVRKEAFVKAVGRGIALGLNRCEIDPENQTHFLTIPQKYGSANLWKIMDVTLDEGSICAVVTKDLEIKYRERVL